MDLYWKAAAGVLLAAVLILTIRKQELGMLLCMAVCVMVLLAAVKYLEPVMELLQSLEEIGGVDRDMVLILMKAVGIGLVTEIAGMICADSGNASAGRALQLLGTAATLWISIPLFTTLMELIRETLEGL